MSLTSTHTTEEWVMRDMRILERPSTMLKVKASVQRLIVSIYQKRLAVCCLVMNHLQSKESFTVKGVIYSQRSHYAACNTQKIRI